MPSTSSPATELVPKPSTRSVASFLELIKPSRSEQGCLKYELLQNADDPTDFTFVETFASEEALKEHAAVPYIAGLAAKLEGFLARPADVSRYHAIAADQGRSGS